MRSSWVGPLLVLVLGGIVALFAQTMTRVAGVAVDAPPARPPGSATSPTQAPASAQSPLAPAAQPAAPTEARDGVDPQAAVQAAGPAPPAAAAASPITPAGTATDPPPTPVQRAPRGDPPAPVRSPAAVVAVPADVASPLDPRRMRETQCRTLAAYRQELDRLASAADDPARLAGVEQQRRVAEARARELGC